MKSQSSKSLPGAYGSGFPTLMSSGRGFDTDCLIVLTASAFIAVLLTNFNHLCSELIELTSQHLIFLSRCHCHSISQYRNTRNKSIPKFQDNLLRYHARMGNHAKRVNLRCALWMMRALFSLSDLGPRRLCVRSISVKSTVTGCDVTYCATTLQGFNKHASSRREAVSDSRGVPACTEKIPKKVYAC